MHWDTVLNLPLKSPQVVYSAVQKGDEGGFYILEYKAAPFTVIIKFILHLYMSPTTLSGEHWGRLVL